MLYSRSKSECVVLFSVRTAVYSLHCSVAMLPSGHVRGELVSVLAPVTTQVALKGVSEAVAAHVDGVHDVVKEQNATVFTPVRPHLLPVCRHHLEAFGGHLHAGSDGLELPLLLLLHQREDAVPGGDVVGEIDEAWSCSARAILIVALCVCGVLAAVAGGAVLLAGRRLGVGEQQQVLCRAVFGRQAGPRVAFRCRFVKGEQGAKAHIRGGGRGGLDQRTKRLGSKVADGAVDRLVHDVRLNHLACSYIIGQV